MPTKKELYLLTKEMLYSKFDGRCAFCGDNLGDRWCIWEIEPRETVVRRGGEIILGNDSYQNKLPACVSCNGARVAGSSNKNDKIDIEGFRRLLYSKFGFIRENAHYRHALRYGLVEETDKPIVFYFEIVLH